MLVCKYYENYNNFIYRWFDDISFCWVVANFKYSSSALLHKCYFSATDRCLADAGKMRSEYFYCQQ